ncbi:MAG: hypothetical protein MSC30_09520 [Gaiellaceae bacterium MAG52_C11]|nr:hypothetical protein [Candidatus Gaiellasilicea maunaloa]
MRRLPLRRLFGLALLIAGPVLWFTRRRDERRERVSLYYDDGSMITLERGLPGSERLLELARASLH